MNRVKVIQTLGEYFTKKGKVLSIEEYKKQTDAPMRWLVIKRVFNSWSRMELYIKSRYPQIGQQPVPVVNKPVIKKPVKKVVKKPTITTKKVKKDVK